MANQASKYLRAAVLGGGLSLVASASYAIGPDAAPSEDAAASGTCLSGPKGAAPKGERWRYRVERGTKKHCWYTRANTARAVAQRSSKPEAVDVADDTPATPLQPAAAPQSAAPLQPSVANARAEAAPSTFSTPPSFPSPQIATPVADDAAVRNRTLVDRMSDIPDAGQSQPISKGTAQPVMKPSPDNQGSSLWMLLGMIGGALALVGGLFALINRFARPRASQRTDDHWSSARWETSHDETSPPLALDNDEPPTKSDGPPMNWVRIARDEADRRDEDIEHLLSRPGRTA